MPSSPKPAVAEELTREFSRGTGTNAAARPENPGLRAYLEYLGRPPPACPLEVETLEKTELEKYTRIKLRFQSEPGEKVPAYLLMPRPVRGPMPTMIALHPHGGQFHLGKSEAVGLTGNLQHAYAHELAERGFVVLAADAPAFEERIFPGTQGIESERRWAEKELARGFSLRGKAVWDISRSVDLLQTLDHVDHRIGVMGHSMGGWMTLFSMAVETRLRVGIVSCGFQDLSGVGHYLRPRPGSAGGPEQDSGFGRAQLVKELIAPRSLLIISPTQDQDAEGVRRDVEAARPAYALAGRPECLKLWIPEGRHRFPSDLRARAYDWLEGWL